MSNYVYMWNFPSAFTDYETYDFKDSFMTTEMPNFILMTVYATELSVKLFMKW